MPFESRLEAAAFILGKEDLQLARLEEPDRHRIRSHFPEFFREGQMTGDFWRTTDKKK